MSQNDPIKYDPSRPDKLRAFADRYHESCQHHASDELLIRDLILYIDSVESHFQHEVNVLEKKLRDLQLDLDSSERTRRDIQAKLNVLETKLGYAPDHNPYIVVLIDGDGLIFKNSSVNKGVEGGKKAADELIKAINERLSLTLTETTSVTVFVTIYADVIGLGKAMIRDGCLSDSNTLHDFVIGFNQANVSSTFVDVRLGKELADAKILDSLKFHLRNFNCKKAVLGISHDADYAPILAKMITDDTKDRITILEGTPTVPELVALGLHTFNIPRLFRHEKLSVKPQNITSQSPPIPSNAASWASVARTPASPLPKITLPIPLKTTAPPSRANQQPPVPWNPGPRGLDPVIRVDRAVMDRLRKRRDTDRLCNNHFLRGPCTRGKECHFTHDYNPTNEEKKVIALFSRSNPCALGQNCTISDCIYGHHCPFVKDGVCVHPHCKFRLNEHPPGTAFRGPRPKNEVKDIIFDDEYEDQNL
ncbi:uncharacterized protein F4812DRAFT_414934 [Daldinia caldariorum]|uniref:uncharacterized protein n=1 Tax=Daldinia caldariorum TaxID=326644 RepID=UPI00200725CF|nr:uncharacterized protein F4812DRAFT_414934 [Daldinia caldariorum]KAI1471632.1 hypothetical protein F4812DRAFT_414934 [Daldinia caldariorum]